MKMKRVLTGVFFLFIDMSGFAQEVSIYTACHRY
jgi:hypothetical protein